jgi:hypothetical protein
MHMAQGMAHIHNMYLRCLNAIYQQAPYISNAADIKDFLTLLGHLHDMILHHHDVEEERFFPALEALAGNTGKMAENVAQHRAFEAGLAAIDKYARNTNPENYDSAKLRSLIDDFAPTLREHLTDEIPTLLALSDCDSIELKRVWKDSRDYAKSSGVIAVQIPFMIGTYDVTYEGKAVSDVEMPWFVSVLNKLVLNRKYTGCWRFLPCDWNSRPRPLAFGPKDEKDK